MAMRVRLHRLVSAAIMVGTLLLASCSAGPATPAPSDASSKVTKPYGSLTVATNFGAGHIDPQLEVGVFFTNLGGAVMDTLVYIDINTKQYVPGIAERWEISADGKRHTFFIRKGVKFHDGSDLTGVDVKFSIARMMAPESLSSGAPTWRAQVTSVELKDDYTVVLHLKNPYFELLLASSSMGAVMPKRYIEEKGVDYFRKNPVGSGPFKVLSFVPGNRLELEALESHWRVVPKFKNITALAVTEEGTKVAMLKTGELDMATVAPDSVAGLRSAGVSILTHSGGSTYWGYPLYDTEHPERNALGDVRVRKALQLAVNSKEIGDTIFRGYGEPFYAFSVTPWQFPWFDPAVMKPDPFDPEQAKKLLAEAGYGNGFNTRINDMRTTSLLSTIDLAVAGYWRKLGVNADIVPIDYAVFFPKMNAKSPDTRGSYYVSVSAGGPQPGGTSWNHLHSTKGVPKNHKNARLDWIIDNLASTPDPALRKQYAIEGGTLIKSEYMSLSIVVQKPLVAHGSKVGGVTDFGDNDVIKARQLGTITHAK